MGFGILFAGYFLLLDVAYFLITDIIAAALIALGLSKLSYLNRGFKSAFTVSLIFLLFALVEFGFGAYEMLFSTIDNDALISYGAIIRHTILCLLSLTSFEGMRDISAEVGLNEHSKKCKASAYLAIPVFALAIIAETPSLFAWSTSYVAAVIAVISMLAVIFYLIFALYSIFGCYARICMPDDNKRDNSNTKKERVTESFRDAYRRQREEREAARAARKRDK